ncbi:MAG: tetratricopeptide repeat protein [Desulfobacterales bacterium]|nr:tetratricopeptide repeat protein [Desulfobacterales bacterium]
MKKILVMAILSLSLMVCLTSPAWAGGLDDYKAGQATAQKRNYDEAIRLFTKAIASGELSQENVSDTYNNRGNAWYAKGDYDKAIADYTKALEINPRGFMSQFYYSGRGFAWLKKGDYDKAIADFTTCIEIGFKLADCYQYRGDAWEKKGNHAKAKADYDKAKEIETDSFLQDMGLK